MKVAEITICFNSNNDTACKVEISDANEISLFLSHLIKNNQDICSINVQGFNEKNDKDDGLKKGQ